MGTNISPLKIKLCFDSSFLSRRRNLKLKLSGKMYGTGNMKYPEVFKHGT
jgi:hypothetical protein